MPPTINCTSSLSASCSRQLGKSSHSLRSFSSTTRNDQRITRARRQLFQWLGSQGAPLRNPLPGSTNYLGAYDAQGQLKRVVEASRNKETSKREDRKQTEEGRAPSNEDQPSGQDSAIPPETRNDLIPFPLNKAFISQAVLSEELREEVWSRIMKDGKSVRTVSAELGIEMSRVGAVVRLMEVEKEWKRIVSFTFFSSHSNKLMMII